MIYLDNAATTCYKPDVVIRAVTDAMGQLGNAGRGAHERSLDASRMVYETRVLLAQLFGLKDPGRVAFTANSTESLNIAIQGLFDDGDHVITTAMEHNSVLRPLYLMEQRGVRLTILPTDSKGRISYESLEASIGEDTKAVVCTHASNVTGNLINIARVGEICRRHKILLVVDASQSAGVFDINIEEMGIDVLCFTGHKSLMGPQGIGGICVRNGVTVRPLIVGGSGVQSFSKTHPPVMPTALEAGTLNGHGIAGLRAAIGYILGCGLDSIREREQMLMRMFWEGVKDIPGVSVYGDFEAALRAPIVSLNIGTYDSGEVSDMLASGYGILTRSGAHCAPLMHRALGTEERGAVRFSFSFHNTEEEVRKAVCAVRELAKEGG